jgi:hypothetical protein
MDVIFDIDDTISNSTHRAHLIDKSPKNWDLYFEQLVNDSPITSTISVLKALCAEGHRIILVTGRPEKYKHITNLWLASHSIPYDALYMRSKEYMYISNAEIKNMLLQKLKQDGFNPQLVFEDNPKAIEMWNKNNIVTLQVRLV